MLDQGIATFNYPDRQDSAASYRHLILKKLLENKHGAPVDELAKYLNISRTAVQKHFLMLEKEGLIKKYNRIKTLGRPSIGYILTDKGMAYFPKSYDLFSECLMAQLKNEMSSEQLYGYLRKLGKIMADQYRSRFIGLNEEDRLKTLMALMQELGFYPHVQQNSETRETEINAYNCVYHQIAQTTDEICVLDQTLVEELMNRKVVLRSCMAKGDGACCFSLRPDKS
ncbi:MAG: helix-turn-helix transcriptional regulator [Gammaproteobacteria bacterium]